MKKILTIGFILISLISYSKPIPVYVLRYKGQVLDVLAVGDMEKIYNNYVFHFNKKEMSDSDLINCLSSIGFYMDNNNVRFIYSVNDRLPKNITVKKEIYNFK